MRHQFKALAAALVLMTGACAYPVSTVGQGGQPSGVYFPDGRTDLLVSIDGGPARQASGFGGPTQILQLTSGQHRIVVRQADGAVVYDRQIYVGDGSQVAIRIPSQ